MKVKFIASDLNYSIDSICSFYDETEGNFFIESLFMLYPQIDKKEYASLKSGKEKRAFLKPILSEIYHSNKNNIEAKALVYQAYWDENKNVVQKGLEKVFSIDMDGLFNAIEARVGINPVSPRYLNENAFDIIHLYSHKGAIIVSLHEIIHLVWFYVWNQHFNDDISEYENPHLKWIFSEIVPDMIMHKAGLGFLNPENKPTIYPYFNEITIGGVKILDILDETIRKNNISDFMKKGYAIFIENEEKIRNAMN